MKKKPSVLSRPWRKAYLVLGIILIGLWIVGYFKLPSSQRLVSEMILIFVSWAPLIFQLIGLRATSSICAFVASVSYVGLALYLIITPGYNKIYALLPVLLATFYYFGSTKTWQLHEEFWLMEMMRQTESEKKIG